MGHFSTSIVLFVGIVALAVSLRYGARVGSGALRMSSPSSINGKYSREVINNLVINPFKIISLTATAVAVYQAPALADEAKVAKVKKPKVKETELGIKYLELKKGEGAYPSEGDYVVINYSAFFLNGTMFDTTEKKGGKPLSFRYGRKQIIPGIESVLESMQPGGERTCTIPAEYAYGKKGVCVGDQCLVPPDTPVRYAIKLKSVGAGFN